ncbi:TPA: YchO/YchP family invasin [Pluralibacter gergoviae]|uniref:YchO/YchP family invasin n=1 Tax=Pluralibacter gergoviae TaxID=61647 RepID=UPI00192959D2|nr:YchO/YchP family invasin [Pluralibacter gergoviae]HDS1150786.1 YchO/YchP family invasin [Pluralibacter gergoviae]
MTTLRLRHCLPLLLLPLAGSAAAVRQSYVEQAKNPFSASAAESLPDMGIAPESGDDQKHLAEMVKAFGEASMVDNGLATGERARQFALDKINQRFNTEFNQQLDYWLSPWGNASAQLLVDDKGNFTGSHGSWFVPLADNDRYLTWSQVGFTRQDEGTVSNLGLGQRWVAGSWLLGYNTFYDAQLHDNLRRGGFGAEAWSEYLRLSANYYQPLSGWRSDSDLKEQRMARGYDVTAQARLPFYRYVNTSLSLEQYFGDNVDLFHSGTGYRNPVAVSLGLNYTPVPLMTLTAEHKQGESGVSQNNVGMKLNYRFGVPLKKQLESSEVAAFTSLRGSRYDAPERNQLPVVEYRQRKTLSVFLATPPWDLKPGETVQLKLQVRSRYKIRSLTWQGDGQALSLTPPVNRNSADGWSIIMPAWDSSEGASNRWHLSVVVEDEKGQRVSSNEITLVLTEPLTTLPGVPSDDALWQP